MGDARRKTIGTVLAVTAVCALALVLRWRGIGHSLPQVTFRDGFYVYTQVELMRSHDPEPERYPFWGLYPHLVSGIVAALPDPEREPLPAGAGLAANLERASATWLQIRAVSVVLSVLGIAATYGIARAFTTRAWALFAALMAATSLLHIFYAQQEKCHGPASATAALAVLAAMHLRRRPTLASCAIAGGAAALAIATLQSGAAVLLPLCAAAWLAMRAPAAQRPPWSRLALGAVLALVLIAAAVRLAYPFHFSDRPLAMDGTPGEAEGTFQLSGHNIEWAWFRGRGFVVVLDALISYEPVALLLALAALGTWIVRRVRGSTSSASIARGDAWVVLAYVVPYLLAIGVYDMTYHRFVLPLLPYLAVAAALGARSIVAALTRSAARGSVRTIARAALASALLVPPTALAWKLGSVRAADDTNTRAAAWIREHVRTDEQVYVLPYIDLPLFYADDLLQDDAALRRDMFWRVRQAELSPEQRRGDKHRILFPGGTRELNQALGDDPLAYFESIAVDYVVIQEVGEGFRFRALPRTREALRRGAELVSRITPLAQDSGRPAKLTFQYTASAFERPFFAYLWGARSQGATLEIYRVSAREGGAEFHDDAATPEALQRQMKALESIGYAGGTTPASERSGVTIHDAARACAGLNLMVSGHAPAAELRDMQGRAVHRWSRAFGEIWPARELPQSRNDASSWRRARVLPGGDLLAIFEGLGLVKLDRDSRVLWAFDGLAHHDLDLAPDGRVFVLTRRARVDPRFHAEKPILEDFVTILDAAGRELESISVLECFANSPHLAAEVFHAGDVFHTNALQLLDGRHAALSSAFAAGNVLVSLRTTGQLAILDLPARTVAWQRTGSWKQQHEPVLLDDGRMLVFDNKGRRERSSVLEIEPLTGDVIWSYAPEAKAEFYSASCGSVQRLVNGNTLIVSSEQGRAFEVARDGAIVWEFWSPHRFPGDPRLVALLFDVVRLEPSFETDWLE